MYAYSWTARDVESLSLIPNTTTFSVSFLAKS